MWEQQPALLPPTWSPLMPLLQRCRLVPKSGGFAPSPAFMRRLRLWPGGSTPLFLCPLSPLAFLLNTQSGGSLVFPVVKLLQLKPIQRQAGTAQASNHHPGGTKLPCAGMPTGDPREKRWSQHTCDLCVWKPRASPVRDEQTLTFCLQLLSKVTLSVFDLRSVPCICMHVTFLWHRLCA